ncbi:MAG: YscO family type III secretion system apparatus protein [Alphaproteobacteria bacterium]|nr:YscO family type III secretion system apparatus protein [Alphaproteobacteria bacterium]
MSKDALSQLRSLREKRADTARLAVTKAEHALADAKHNAELARQTLDEYAAQQQSLIAACYAPVLGKQKSRAEVMNARADAGEILLERANLEEAVTLADEVVKKHADLLAEARQNLQRLERRLEALVQLEKKREQTRRVSEQRAADEILDSVSEARWTRDRRAS